MPAFDETPATTALCDARNATPRVVFVSGYRRKALENYHALNTVARACAQANLNCTTISFDTIPAGKYKKQPPFSEMVRRSAAVLNGDPRPSVLLGHCGGGAVALEASKHVDPDLLLGVVFLCPPLAVPGRVSFLKKSGLNWLRKNVFASADFRDAAANKATYLAVTKEVFGRMTQTELRCFPNDGVVLVGATGDKIYSAEATKRLAGSLGVSYRSIQDGHSPKQEESAHELADILASLIHNGRDFNRTSAPALHS
ncbi:MAG: alpha/beta hydrolase [Alphaproteobacteria bacterium]|nr:alpha/beta hydrolase [Alphaproteobacteria bacterium]